MPARATPPQRGLRRRSGRHPGCAPRNLRFPLMAQHHPGPRPRLKESSGVPSRLSSATKRRSAPTKPRPQVGRGCAEPFASRRIDAWEVHTSTAPRGASPYPTFPVQSTAGLDATRSILSSYPVGQLIVPGRRADVVLFRSAPPSLAAPPDQNSPHGIRGKALRQDFA